MNYKHIDFADNDGGVVMANALLKLITPDLLVNVEQFQTEETLKKIMPEESVSYNRFMDMMFAYSDTTNVYDFVLSFLCYPCIVAALMFDTNEASDDKDIYTKILKSQVQPMQHLVALCLLNKATGELFKKSTPDKALAIHYASARLISHSQTVVIQFLRNETDAYVNDFPTILAFLKLYK